MTSPTPDFSPLSDALEALWETVQARKAAAPEESYTAKLLHKGVEKCAQKLGEEAIETALAAVQGKQGDTAAETADLLYHLCVLLTATGVTPQEVAARLAKRQGLSGLEEKRRRQDDPV